MISQRSASKMPGSKAQPPGVTARRIRPGMSRIVLAITLASGLGGCASTRALFPASSLEPLPWDSPVLTRTLDPQDAWLRHYLLSGDPASAVAFLDAEGEPRISDSLLHDLQAAIAARSSGELERSNTLLEQADLELERRRVLSVGETAGSYLVSDRLRSYLPATSEAALIPFYRMLNYLALGERQAAAVEARRVSAVVDAASEEALGGCRQAAMLNYAAAFVYEGAGELNDALVSLRRAEAAMNSCEIADSSLHPYLSLDVARVATALGFDDLATSSDSRYVTATGENEAAGPNAGAEIATETPPRAIGEIAEPPAVTGEVLVLIEQGFIAHRAEGTLHIPLFEDEIDDLHSDDPAKVAEVAALVAGRMLGNFAEKGYYGRSWDDQPFVQVGQSLSGAHIVRLAWPELHEEDEEDAQLRVLSGADTMQTTLLADLSEAADRNLSAEHAASLTRLVSRALMKFIASQAIENRAEKRGGELLGFVAGRLSNLAANATERADTRSWSLLPDRISLARFTLPAGEQQLEIQSQDPETGAWSAVDLGSVMVEAGGVVVINRRIWSDSPADPSGSASGADPTATELERHTSLRDSAGVDPGEEQIPDVSSPPSASTVSEAQQNAEPAAPST